MRDELREKSEVTIFLKVLSQYPSSGLKIIAVRIFEPIEVLKL